MNKSWSFAASLLFLTGSAYAQSAPQQNAQTGVETKSAATTSAGPKNVFEATPGMMRPSPKGKTNPACGVAAPPNTNPCAEAQKRALTPLNAQPQDLTASGSQLNSTSTPVDQSSLDPPAAAPFAFSPVNPDTSLILLNGVQTATRKTSVGPVRLSTSSTSSAPSITNVSPDFGNPGTVVTITGTGFGSPESNSYVDVFSTQTFEYTNWPVQEWTDTQIVATVPSMPSGKVYFEIYVAGIVVQGTSTFTVGIPPAISTYSPAFGLPGTTITINGSGFGQSSSSNYVSVISAVTGQTSYWPATSWTDTEIQVQVPASFAQGKVYLYVTVAGLETIGTFPFTVGTPPVIDCYSPGFGPPGTLVTINGSGFGATKGNSYVEVLSKTENTWMGWPVSTWSDTQITVPIPANTPIGLYYITVNANGLQSIETDPIEVGFPPVIADYSPGYGDPGTQITINGSGFGQTQGTSVIQALSAVTNTWTNLPVSSWSDSQAVVTIPATMPLGKVYLYVVVGPLESIGTFPFTVGIPPSITSYSPSTGPAGTVITINGTGFGSAQGGSYLTLQSVTNIYTGLTVISWSDTQVTVSIPKLAPTCLSYLSITVDGLQSIGTFPFQVTSQ